MAHQITRRRHEPRRRRLVVSRIEQVTPRMARVWIGGPELEGFHSPSADDHIKIAVPGPDGELERRDFTPRRYDPVAGELAIDFALHEDGAAMRWLREARPGGSLQIGGPRGSTIVSDDFDWYLLIGDESALPSIGRRAEELPATADVVTLVTVADAGEEQALETRARHSAIWVHRPLERADDPAPLLEALARLRVPEGDGFVWIAAEAKVARAARAYLLERKGHPVAWLKASGYWVRGQADAAERFE